MRKPYLTEVLERTVPPQYAERLVRRLLETDILQHRGIVRAFFTREMGQGIADATISYYLSHPLSEEAQTLSEPLGVSASLENKSAINVVSSASVVHTVATASHASIEKIMPRNTRKKRTFSYGGARTSDVAPTNGHAATSVGVESPVKTIATSFIDTQPATDEEISVLTVSMDTSEMTDMESVEATSGTEDAEQSREEKLLTVSLDEHAITQSVADHSSAVDYEALAQTEEESDPAVLESSSEEIASTDAIAAGTLLDLDIVDEDEAVIIVTGQIGRTGRPLPNNEDGRAPLPPDNRPAYVPQTIILGTERNLLEDPAAERTSKNLVSLALGDGVGSAINTMLETVGQEHLTSERIYKICWAVTDPLRGSGDAVSDAALHAAIVQLHEVWEIPLQDAPIRLQVAPKSTDEQNPAKTVAMTAALLELERSVMHPVQKNTRQDTFASRASDFVSHVPGAKMIDLSSVESGPREARQQEVTSRKKSTNESKYFDEDVLGDDFDMDDDMVAFDAWGTNDADDEGEVVCETEDFAALGIDPYQPTKAKPGSEAKVLMLCARYSAGLPLWHEDDLTEHGPSDHHVMGQIFGGAL